MRKIYLSVCICFCFVISDAQVEFVAAGTFQGGSPIVNIGTFKTDGTSALLHDFKITDPTDCSSVIVGPDGKLYGSTSNGGVNHTGAIFSVDQDGTNFKVVYSNKTGNIIPSKPVFGPDGELYTIISDSLYQLSADGSSTKLITALTRYARSILFDNEGWIYGLGGEGFYSAYIFRIKMNGSQYSILHTFDPLIDGYLDEYSKLCLTPTQRIFLTTHGVYPNYGTLISMKKDGSEFKINKLFTDADNSTYGTYPITYESVTHSEGKIIFRTSRGGNGNPIGSGTILLYDTATSTLSTIFILPVASGNGFPSQPQVINGKLVAVGSDGLYSVNQDGSDYQMLNAIPAAGSAILSYDPATNSIFYTASGGKYKNTYLLKTNLTTNTSNNVHSFGNVPDGYNPEGIIKAPNGLLYGITQNGGATGGGTVFKMNTDGTGFKTLKDFNDSNGQSPFGQLFYASDKRLYGICKTTGLTGLADSMVLFGINTDGTNYSTIHKFSRQSEYINPELTEGIGGQLFGVIGFPGIPSIFKVDKNGSGYTILKTFSGTTSEGTGGHQGGLFYYKGYLYGTNKFGGNPITAEGNIFRLSENGNDFSIIKNFIRGEADGSSPEGGLTLAADRKLYGATTSGGTNYRGTIFSIDPEDLSYKLVGSINNNEGIPVSRFLPASNGKLYSATTSGILQMSLDSVNRRLTPYYGFSLYTNRSSKTYFSEIPTPITTQLCPPTASTILKSGITGATYQWQLNTGNGFENISNNTNYSGTNSDSLQLINISSSWTGYEYRCLADDGISDIYKIKFANNWTGSVNSAWENAANWSCGTIPDANTDVVISSGTIVLNSNATVRSLQINPTVNFTVNTGLLLTVTH